MLHCLMLNHLILNYINVALCDIADIALPNHALTELHHVNIALSDIALF